MPKTFRIGALGALMDEYERAGQELARLSSQITEAEFKLVRDTQTWDEHCRSIQTILNHLVQSGYGYADYIRHAFSMPSERPEAGILSVSECPEQIELMLAYMAATLEGRWHFTEAQIMAVQMLSRWGPKYDLEQLLEHAIVHILRHRRQIERFLEQGEAAQD
jgi:uncharacterized damage-inducible protein DinB